MTKLKPLLLPAIALFCALIAPSSRAGSNSASLLMGAQTYDAMAAALGLNVSFGESVAGGPYLGAYNSMRLLLSSSGDPTKVSPAQSIAYIQVAYSLCFEALRQEQTLIPATARLFLGSIIGSPAPSAITPAMRLDVIRKMNQRFFASLPTSTEETSLVSLVDDSALYAQGLSESAMRIPTVFAPMCSVLLGSVRFVGD